VDRKGKLKIGKFSRGGVACGRTPVAAADHDMPADALLTPACILAVDNQQLSLVFGTSRDTSDFIADGLEWWWENRRTAHLGVRQPLINLDHGPQTSSSRTQFIKRLVEFPDLHQLTLELAYYPPCHSKYNRIERCWGILENHWNGTPLNSVSTALHWAQTITWHGVTFVVHLLDQVYQTGLRIMPHRFGPIAARLHRWASRPKWSLVIHPQSR